MLILVLMPSDLHTPFPILLSNLFSAVWLFGQGKKKQPTNEFFCNSSYIHEELQKPIQIYSYKSIAHPQNYGNVFFFKLVEKYDFKIILKNQTTHIKIAAGCISMPGNLCCLLGSNLEQNKDFRQESSWRGRIGIGWGCPSQTHSTYFKFLFMEI